MDKTSQGMRPIPLLFWLATLATVAWFSLRPQPEFPVDFPNADKLYHLGAYFVLGLLGIWSFTSRRGRIGAAVLTVAFGIGIEFLQGFMPGRMPSAGDGLANAVGVIIAWAIIRLRK